MPTILAKEVPELTQDVDLDGLVVDSEIVLATALLAAGSPLQRTKVIEVEVEYESTEVQTLFIEYSTDQGTTWVVYSSFPTVITTGPTIIARRKTLSHHNIQLRLRSVKLGAVRIIGFYPRLVAGEKVNR